MKKSGTFIITTALLLTASIAFAEDMISLEDTFGTWINSDYNFSGQNAKIIVTPEGIVEEYRVDTDTEPIYRSKRTITASWHDSNDNLWMKCVLVELDMGEKLYELDKFSDSGRVWELVWRGSDFPVEMSPIGGSYEIHYRQE
jgi:hypothetical protein